MQPKSSVTPLQMHTYEIIILHTFETLCILALSGGKKNYRMKTREFELTDMKTLLEQPTHTHTHRMFCEPYANQQF